MLSNKKSYFEMYLSSSDGLDDMKECGVLPLHSSVSNPPDKKLETQSSDDHMNKVHKRRKLFVQSEGTPASFKADLIKKILKSQEGAGMFEMFSDELMLTIFSRLPKESLHACSKVCKRWRHLSFDSSLWKYLHISGTIFINLVKEVIELGVVALSLRDTIRVIPEVPPVLNISSFSKLEYLDLGLCHINHTELHPILSSCRKLKKLSLERVRIWDETCCLVAQNKDLEVLDMCMTIGFTVKGINDLCVSLPKLETWNLSWAGMLGGNMEAFAEAAPSTLKRLNISGSRTKLSDENLETIMRRCPNLLELDVSDSHLLTSVSLENAKKLLPHLESAYFCRCRNIDPRSYEILKDASSIQDLQIYGVVTEKGIEVLRKRCPKININTDALQRIARPTSENTSYKIWGIDLADCSSLAKERSLYSTEISTKVKLTDS